MAYHNTYVSYKRDTRDLVRWMIQTSNNIFSSSSPATQDTLPASLNTSGEIQVSDFIPLSSLIAKHINPIPSVIYRLFQSVIDARTQTYALFQQIVSTKPDPEIEKSNASHQHFIATLTKAFKTLGGDEWAARSKAGTSDPEEEDIDEVLLLNKFSALSFEGPSDGDEDEDAAEEASQHPQRRPAKNSRGKGKKGKRGKKAKGKKSVVDEPKLEDVPLESYRIIESEGLLVTDYLLAVYSIAREWIDLRLYLQGTWREVAYGNLNSAVAGAVSNLAVAMIEQTESAIFVNFPGHESYETVLKTITRGDPDRTNVGFHLSLHQMDPVSGSMHTKGLVDLDMKEHLLIHAYYDLLDFILDFQNTRSGKPTKRMLAEIRNWDPDYDLQNATKEQRIKWRRSYTINWLYDLVNVFSSIVVQRNNLKGQNWALEDVDWSENGPWNKHRRLFGLNKYAGDITSLAMQKKGTDIRQRILPRHVFQTQCIVDSLAASRGWSVNVMKGHMLYQPAEAFRPRRDVDLFMDRENERFGHGYCDAVSNLITFFGKDAMLHGDPNRHQDQSELLKEFMEDFVNWLGESKYMYGLKTIPPSRFINTNANGLWEYSPYLCGVGLVEALDLSYGMSLLVWDRIPEPICLIHLQNMLVKKGYIAEPVGLYNSLQEMFRPALFVDGKLPTSDFDGAFLALVNETRSRRANYKRRAIRRNILRTTSDIHGALGMDANRFFKQKSLLRIYQEAQWVPERILDEDICPISLLGSLRLHMTKKVVDPTTGKKVLEDTALTRKARASGISDEALVVLSGAAQQSKTETPLPLIPPSLRTAIPNGFNGPLLPKDGKQIYSGSELLDILRMDLINDITGDSPYSSLNYVWVTIRFMMLFHQVESELQRVRNPSWVRAYETDASMMREKRVSLTAIALAGHDEEVLQVFVNALVNPRTGFMNHIYWEDLCDAINMPKLGRDPLDSDETAAAGCEVM